jgi:hypothetical protein
MAGIRLKMPSALRLFFATDFGEIKAKIGRILSKLAE